MVDIHQSHQSWSNQSPTQQSILLSIKHNIRTPKVSMNIVFVLQFLNIDIAYTSGESTL